MAKYLFTGSFTAAGIAGIRQSGGSARVAAVSRLAESAGGHLDSYYFAYGADDFFVGIDAPDNTAAAAAALAVGATGAVNLRTIALLTAEEIDAASKLTPVYQAPGT